MEFEFLKQLPSEHKTAMLEREAQNSPTDNILFRLFSSKVRLLVFFYLDHDSTYLKSNKFDSRKIHNLLFVFFKFKCS